MSGQLGGWLTWRRRDFKTLFCLAVCWAVAILYFVWWLSIELTWQAWLRRIVDGLRLRQILAVIAFVTVIAHLSLLPHDGCGELTYRL